MCISAKVTKNPSILSPNSSSLEANLRSAIRCCRPYFPPGTTQEMLDEWRPLMCPYDVTMGKAFVYFNIFLPTFNVLDHRDRRSFVR